MLQDLSGLSLGNCKLEAGATDTQISHMPVWGAVLLQLPSCCYDICFLYLLARVSKFCPQTTTQLNFATSSTTSQPTLNLRTENLNRESEPPPNLCAHQASTITYSFFLNTGYLSVYIILCGDIAADTLFTRPDYIFFTSRCQEQYPPHMPWSVRRPSMTVCCPLS
jgi:hypothetical protein